MLNRTELTEEPASAGESHAGKSGGTHRQVWRHPHRALADHASARV